MKYLLIIFCFLMPAAGAMAQQFNVNLSNRHQAKITSAKSGHQKMKRFYKYYSKDSSRQSKIRDKKYKRELDSTFKAQRKEYKQSRKLARKGIVLPKPPDTLNDELQKAYRLMDDTTVADSVRNVARQRVKVLVMNIVNANGDYQQMLERYHVYGDSIDWKQLSTHIPGVDTLQNAFGGSPEKMFEQSEKMATELLTKHKGNIPGNMGQNFSELDKWKNLGGQYTKLSTNVSGKDELREQGEEKLSEKKADLLSKSPEVLEKAHGKLSNVLSRYRVFSNSNDLSDAKKNSSLSGKSFFERLIIGGHFNVVSIKPVSLDLYPEIGYRWSSKLGTSLGINYRHTFGDTIRSSRYISPRNTALRFSTTYDVIKNFYAYSEVMFSSIASQDAEVGRSRWIGNYFIGVGRKFLIHPKLYMTSTAAYNMNGDKKNPVFLQRFQVRIGFQLSELALRKKPVHFNPNR